MKTQNIVLLGLPGLHRGRFIAELRKSLEFKLYDVDEMMAKPHQMTPKQVVEVVPEEDILEATMKIITRIPPKNSIVTSSTLIFLPGTLTILRKNSLILHLVERIDSLMSYFKLHPETIMQLRNNSDSLSGYIKKIHGLGLKYADQTIQLTDASSIKMQIRRIHRKLT